MSAWPVYVPHAWHHPIYGSNKQHGTPIDETPKLLGKALSNLQSIVKAFLYHMRAVESSIYLALKKISIQQSAQSEATRKTCLQLLDYVATHPNATTKYHTNDILNVDSDATYLVLP